MFALALALMRPSEAGAEIEFKSSSPVSIYVDGRQTTQPNPLRHKATDLDSGIHQLKVVGMFGKTLYEAEIDLPDNTITYAAWERGEIKVLSTDWLPKTEEVADVADDTGADEEELEVVEVPPPAPVETAETEVPAPAAEPEAVAAVDPGPSAAGTTAAVAAGVAAGAALDEEPEAIPEVASPAAAAAPPVGRTLTLTAVDGMKVEIVHNGQKLVVAVAGDTFQIQDGSGLSFALSGVPAPAAAAGTASESP